MASNKIRVAAAQFHVGQDLQANLEKCLSMLDRAAQHNPDLVVLPEFCNHLSWYDDKAHAFDVSVPIGGEFLAAIADRARAINAWVVVNCTVQREDGSATGSSLMYSPEGELVADNTKQIYIGHENDFLKRATEPGPIVDTPFGRVGLYACMDGVINETPRGLALRGAQLLCNSLNSFASDEGSLHIPVRAAENKVFVVAANKVGPLVPEAMVEPISTATGIPPRFLDGAGESQVVAPDGTVLARASLDTEEVIFADIDLGEARVKVRPDGTDVFDSRRPSLYQAIGEDPEQQPVTEPTDVDRAPAAIVQLSSAADLAEATAKVAEAVASGARLIALPPLLPEGLQPAEAASLSDEIVSALAACVGEALVSTTAVWPSGTGFQFGVVLIGANGVVLQQGQVQPSQRLAWSALAEQIQVVETPAGRVGLCTSDDALYPEHFRRLAMAGAEVVCVPVQPLEAWELQTGLLERSAENHINLLAAAQPSALGNSLATTLPTDFTVMTEWQERDFDGLLSQPVLMRCPADAGVFPIEIAPVNAANKVVSANTDLLADRPWQLCGAITARA